ncbi:MAG: glycosyltransferase family 2 protein [Patescibacteria group bacterium]|nr:glycosyltransferase family 2 protein [Patescibacteria group bacterium]
MKVIGVVPAFNEEKRITDVLRAYLAYVDEIVVVDDGSNDKTAEAAKIEKVNVLRHAVNRGQGAALRTGTTAALELGAEVIVHLDADGQHNPKNIPELIKPLAEGQADVVMGSRFMNLEPSGMPLTRYWLLKAARVFNTMALGIPKTVTDPQCGLRAMTAKAARTLDFKQDGFAHASELLRLITRSGLRWREIPVSISYSQESLGKKVRPDALRIVWHLFIGVFTK